MQSSSVRDATRLRARLHHWLTRPSPARYVALGYLLYMAAGWALLMLPPSQAQPVAAIDALFIAVSAVSTTGLVSVDPASVFSGFGEGVILALIQVGGLGFMTISTFAWAALSRPTTFQARVARNVFSVAATEDIGRFLRRAVIFTLVVEAIGAAALYPLLVAAGEENALWSAIFHSVSAFCTAGFSLYADSLERFAGNPLVLGVISVLSLLGAIGFLVLSELWDRLRGGGAPLGLTARLVLRVFPTMILAGGVLLLVVEPSLAARPMGERAMNALFQSLSAATTVGFNSVPLAGIAPAAIMAIYVLMLIGASPSGTGGGLKVTTVAVLLGLLRGAAKDEADIRVLGLQVRPERVRQAAGVLVAAILLLAAALFAMALTETQPFEKLLFEALSALGTVGLSLGATGELSDAGKLVVIALMAVGRIGVLGFAIAVAIGLRRREASREAPADVVL